ncbi:MAG TPA: tetratricopeptide repeat protein [Candidatus Sulfotelmatobacter sp.]|nr:tetratricopeptide repeat protein [Candidatus Sulfotelmatobacter sp.]
MKGWAQNAAIGFALVAAVGVAGAANDSARDRTGCDNAIAASEARTGTACRAPTEQAASYTTAKSPVAAPTYARDIAPILFRSCATCHRPGEAAPFSLLSYADAKSHARLIEEVTKRRIMPPWLPAAEDPKFADDLRLSDADIARLRDWAESGAAEGNPADLPPAPQFVEGWQLGKPDVIVKATKVYALAAGGGDAYWNFVFRSPVDRLRWLKAIEIRPGDKRLVHHANVLMDRGQTARLLEKTPGDGFGGMELTIESELFDPDSHFLFWKPGSAPYVEPDGMAIPLDANSDLVLNTHLQPSGKAETLQPTLGLYFTDKPATLHPILLQMENDGALDIPAGAKDFVVSDEFTLPVSVSLLAIYPHAHYLGKNLEALATLPDGKTETLIHIPNWDLNWQAVYRYAEPMTLPAGTKITMRFAYDNSTDNVRNPNHPPQRVVAGNRASDEMAHLWLQVLPTVGAGEGRADPRALIQEAMARHHLEKNPEDFEAHYNLAALLQARGDAAGSTAQFSEAVRLRPSDAAANNGLGAALLAAGQTERAIPFLQAALKARPDYFDAHYNLGNALASNGDFGGALEHFRAAVRLRPQDADAEANLGSALAETGDVGEARRHFERALQLNPNHQLARENLQQLEQGGSSSPSNPR